MRSTEPYDSLFTRSKRLLSSVFLNIEFFIYMTSVADPDPGSGGFLNPGSRMGKKSRSGSGMSFPHHISESLETIFGDPDLFDPGFEMEKIRI